jgi:hypothetical protein
LGKSIVGFVFGLALGLILAPLLFPDGLATAIEHWAENIRSTMPIH